MLRHDPGGAAAVSTQGGACVMANEAKQGLRDAVRTVCARADDLFGLIRANAGGIWGARQIAQVAQAHGIHRTVISLSDRSQGAMANVAFAVSLPVASVQRRLEPTVVTKGERGPQLAFPEGEVVVPRGVGLTFEPKDWVKA